MCARGNIHFMNIGFHYKGEKQLCCGSFFNDPKSTRMNLLVGACLFDMGGGETEVKEGEEEEKKSTPSGILTD